MDNLSSIAATLPPTLMMSDKIVSAAAATTSIATTSIASASIASAAKATNSSAGRPDIKQVGEDFESIFMSLILKEMRSTIGSEEEGGLFAGEGSDTYGGLFDMFLGQHLAKGSHLGIGKAIESYLANQGTS